MNHPKLVIRSLRFYARTGLPVLAGCAVSAAVLVGALFIGDSVRGSLARIALHRLGRIHVALDAGSRYFRDDLARRLDAKASTVLRVNGMAIRDGGQKQVNRVEVLGIDGAFLGLAASPPGITLSRGEVAFNEKLASVLGVKAGDEVSLRMVKPDLLTRDAPLASGKEGNTRRSRMTLKAVLTDAQLGRFGLRTDQTGPMNAFVDLKWLQETLGLEHRANMLLAGETPLAAAVLREAWIPEDAGLKIRSLESHGIVQLESERIYLDPAVSSAASGLLPNSATTLTYLVNSIYAPSGRSTPYSFMTALSPCADRGLGPVPPGMKDDEIIRLLLGLRNPTFFTLDADFHRRHLCHPRYSLVFLDIGQHDTADFVRRVLRHPDLNTQSKRLGTVIRCSADGLTVWRRHAEHETTLRWDG